MKFLHSPSSSSSSSSATETRPNYTAIGCIPAILRRLLCSRTLPTFPFDNHIKDSFVNNEFYCGNELKANPGIVAKLMGLDSMPTVEKFKKGNCVLEAPSFVELENDKFIILSFEGGGKDKKLKLHSLKNQKGLIESKEKVRNRVNQEMHVHEEVMKPTKSCDKRRKMKLEKDEIESDLENLSPVSVLEFSDHQEASFSGKEDVKSKNISSRRKLREDLDKNAPSSLSSSSSSSSSTMSICNSVEKSCRNGKERIGLGKNRESGETWEEICAMVERDVMDSSMLRWKGEDFEEIGVCFESQILDQLILELLLTIT